RAAGEHRRQRAERVSGHADLGAVDLSLELGEALLQAVEAINDERDVAHAVGPLRLALRLPLRRARAPLRLVALRGGLLHLLFRRTAAPLALLVRRLAE